MRPGRTGTGRSSPSEKSPGDRRRLDGVGADPLGRRRAGRSRRRRRRRAAGTDASPSPRVRPNRSRALALVSVSRMSSVTSPDIAAAEALLTTTFSCAASPSRRKRGTYGRTIRSLTLWVSLWIEPAVRSRVTAWTQTFHEVTESGTLNSMTAEPSATSAAAASRTRSRRSCCAAPEWAAAAALFSLSVFERPRRPGELAILCRRRSLAGADAGTGAAMSVAIATTSPSCAARTPGAADAVAVEELEPVAVEHGCLAPTRPRSSPKTHCACDLGRGSPACIRRSRRDSGRGPSTLGRVVRQEDVEAAVVHVGEQLRGPRLDRGVPGGAWTVTRQVSLAPGRSWSRNVANSTFSSLSSHGTKTDCAEVDELVVAHEREAHAEAAAARPRRPGSRSRGPPRSPSDPARDHPAVPQGLDEERLSRQARATRGGAPFSPTGTEARSARSSPGNLDRHALAGDQEVPRRLELRAELVRRLVVQAPRAGGQAPEASSRASPFASCVRSPRALLAAVGPTAQDRLEREAACPSAGAAGRPGWRTDRSSLRAPGAGISAGSSVRGGCDDLESAASALPRPGSPVEIGAR